MISPSGLCLVRNDDCPFLYSVNDHCERPLPTQVDGKRIVYGDIKNTIIGYLVEKRVSPWQPDLFPKWEFRPPAGMRGIASVMLDMDLQPLFDPVPLYIYPYKGKWALAKNYNKHLFLLGLQGNTLRKFPNDWRLLHCAYRYDEAGNLAEFTVYKCADAKAYKKEYYLPQYLYDIQTDSLHGPYRKIGQLQEGIREIVDMDSHIYFVDKDWNMVFSCRQFQKKSPFYITSECFQGHIAFFSVMKAGLLNKQGEVVLKPAYSEICPMGDSLWWYKKKGLYGIMHESGEIMTKPQYMISYLMYFSHGLVPVADKKDMAGYIDHQGNWVIKPSFKACYTFIHPHYTIARAYK